MNNIVLGISGASGIILGVKTAERLLRLHIHVHLVASSAACRTALEELGWSGPFREAFFKALDTSLHPFLHYYDEDDIGAKIASGSFQTLGMCVIPCSMTTVATIRIGLADTLLRRAADVTIKEGRKLLLAVRETPLSAIHLENMAFLARLGVVIMPSVPAWYLGPKTVDDVQNHIVDRVIAQMGFPSGLREWEPGEKFL